MLHGLLFSLNNASANRSSGVHRIANHLRVQGWDIEVVDFFEFWHLDELQEFIRSRVTNDTKFVGFSYLYSSVILGKTLQQFCNWLRQTYPQLLLVSGGQGGVSNYEYIDYHISGYGEYALDALLSYKFSNGPPVELAGDKIINALHSYPAYPLKNPMIQYEARDFIMPNEWGSIEFSRGCKFKCSFCNFPVLGVKEDYTRDTESARLQMQDAYDRYGIKDYLISDETFNDRTEKITKFADVVQSLSWNPYFAGYIRADLLVSRPRDREELIRMGMLGHFYGIETFNPKTAKAIKKGYDPKKLQAGLIEVKEYFKNVVGKKYRADIGLIGGLPYETLESLQHTTAWIAANWKDQVAGAFPLEIQRLDELRKSDISINYKHYGYKEIDASGNVDHADYGANKGIVWENNNMNVFQATKWVETLAKIYYLGDHNLIKLNPFSLSKIICDSKGDPLTTDKKLTLVESTLGNYEVNFNIFVKKYKDKKLNAQ
jgi:hypothetical protein